MNLNQSVTRACQILSSFRSGEELLRLKDIAERTGLHKATALRLIRTLQASGFLKLAGQRRYRSCVTLSRPWRWTIGYATQSTEFAFARAVSESIVQSAEKASMDLVTVDNRYRRATAVRNAESLIRQGVDLVMEFQTHEEIAPVVSSKYLEAGIPVIAIEIPHPGAIYFGANNYQAGLLGGRALGEWALEHWQGRVEEILLLELPQAGPVPASRLTGFLQGVREILPQTGTLRPARLNGNGQFAKSLEATRKHLRRAKAGHSLIGAINDPSAIGVIRAFEEAGRARHCAVMGQNASVEARAEMRRRGSPLIGSVGYFPELYGGQLIRLAADILEKKSVPPAVFTKHQLITPANVDHFYPNDELLAGDEVDILMLQSA